MDKWLVASIAFVAGAAVGAYAVYQYAQTHAAQLLGEGATEQIFAKLFGTGPTATAFGQAAGGAVGGVLH